MYDQPTLDELLDAVRMHLEQHVVPAVRGDRKLYFQTLVAINVLKIAGRERDLSTGHMKAAWARFNALEGVNAPLPARDRDAVSALKQREAALCGRIRAGEYDSGDVRALLVDHLLAGLTEQLEVANPRFLQALAAERDDPSRDAWHGRSDAP